MRLLFATSAVGLLLHTAAGARVGDDGLDSPWDSGDNEIGENDDEDTRDHHGDRRHRRHSAQREHHEAVRQVDAHRHGLEEEEEENEDDEDGYPRERAENDERDMADGSHGYDLGRSLMEAKSGQRRVSADSRPGSKDHDHHVDHDDRLREFGHHFHDHGSREHKHRNSHESDRDGGSDYDDGQEEHHKKKRHGDSGGGGGGGYEHDGRAHDDEDDDRAGGEQSDHHNRGHDGHGDDDSHGDGTHGYDYSSLLAQEVKTRSGVGMKVVRKGAGQKFARVGNRMTVHYTGRLADGGRTIDSSRDRRKPFMFTVGHKEKGKSIPGCVLPALLQMSEGERALIKVPSTMAYGNTGEGSIIPPNADLIFDVEVLAIA
eukprot:TRINITY_DN7101_c0_g1_i3.p1 TRINITY_DN7101_c0_g1~~TRINITY_DN7101_c0_g1_i3.p1  ORF type:complete len:373 (-),score=68.05 TRINITY_DN7101_c0_g1_i3:117-1235(-)